MSTRGARRYYGLNGRGPHLSATRRGRPKSKPGASTATRDARRLKLAAAAIAGTPRATIARKEQISRSWASRETNAPETRLLIAHLLDEHEAKVRELIPKALAVIEEGLRAEMLIVTRVGDGIELNTVPDHRVRLLAAKRLLELGLAGRTAEQPGAAGGGLIEWEHIETRVEEFFAERQ